jgi:membrane protein YdbS with pleckstrin-like domain
MVKGVDMKNVSVQVGPGGPVLLTIIFILLKVFGYISWSWWWVFSPLWIGFAVTMIILMFVTILAVFVNSVDR